MVVVKTLPQRKKILKHDALGDILVRRGWAPVQCGEPGIYLLSHDEYSQRESIRATRVDQEILPGCFLSLQKSSLGVASESSHFQRPHSSSKSRIWRLNGGWEM